MSAKTAGLLMLFLALIAGDMHQSRKIISWEALRFETARVSQLARHRARKGEIPGQLTALFAGGGGWKMTVTTPSTSGRVAHSCAVMRWDEACSALDTLSLHTRNGSWQLQKWCVQTLDSDFERCVCEVTIAAREGL